jgi:hypothetical protein
MMLKFVNRAWKGFRLTANESNDIQYEIGYNVGLRNIDITRYCNHQGTGRNTYVRNFEEVKEYFKEQENNLSEFDEVVMEKMTEQMLEAI